MCESLNRNFVCAACINNVYVYERRKVLAELQAKRVAVLGQLNEHLAKRVRGAGPWVFFSWCCYRVGQGNPGCLGAKGVGRAIVPAVAWCLSSRRGHLRRCRSCCLCC